MDSFQQIAIIGSTASGKSSLAIEYAKKNRANILSLDSLSIYKEIDIVSAKPTIEERSGVKHFGLDVISPHEHFDVTIFIKLYKEAKAKSIEESKNLVIVGGTSFYLRTLLYGLSPVPKISKETETKTSKALKESVTEAYNILFDIDKKYMSNIASTDNYRIEKMLNLYYETGLTPTEYFSQNPPKPTITKALPIYEISVDREILRDRIRIRTQKMLDMGLIKEVSNLEKKYGRTPNCMKAIGIKEVLDFFDNIYTKEDMKKRIIINTARLAKRQRTFNRSQFTKKISLPLDKLHKLFSL